MNSVKLDVNNKNHDNCRDFSLVDQLNLICCLDQSSDAPGAQRFSDFSTTFENAHLLQIGFEFSVGSPHGKTAIMSEGSCFSTFFTLCHNRDPFSSECSYFAGLGTPQQASILPQAVSFYKKSVLMEGELIL
jgi:hypothetical protein